MSFDRLAPHYRWMEWVLAGDKLQSCRTAFLSQIGIATNVLILGEGNGRFLLECRKALGAASITCVDDSSRMLQLARARLENSGQSLQGIEFLQKDALTWKPPARSYDLVVTHFFLDCFRPDQLQRLLAGLANACRPRAQWLLADFQIPEAGVCRLRARAIHWVMYTFFRTVTRLPANRLTVPDRFLESHGFTLRQRLTRDWKLIRSDLWERVER